MGHGVLSGWAFRMNFRLLLRLALGCVGSLKATCCHEIQRWQRADFQAAFGRVRISGSTRGGVRIRRNSSGGAAAGRSKRGFR